MYQNLILIGNLGRDPELKYLPDGTAVCNMSVAVSDRWTDKAGQSQERTTWFRVATFGKLAENCHQYLAKGRQVYVEGELRGDENGNPRTWEGNDGTTHASFEVKAHKIKFLGKKDDAPAKPADEDEDIPF
jgi:single-strand DNA-binding protein